MLSSHRMYVLWVCFMCWLMVSKSLHLLLIIFCCIVLLPLAAVGEDVGDLFSRYTSSNEAHVIM